MFDQTSRDELKALKKYDRIAIYLFRQLVEAYSPDNMPDEIEFDLDLVRSAMKKCVEDGVIDKAVKNVPDIKYVYDARHDMPAELAQAGPVTWLQNGKGRYKLKRTKRKNIIELAEFQNPLPPIEPIPDQTPPFISELIGKDEQAMFTRVRHSHLISTFLGFSAWAIQGHHRTTLSYGQVEIDEVQAGLNGNTGMIVPISGKGGADKLSWSQALNLNTYGLEKAPKDGLSVRSLGLWRDNDDIVWIVEFSPDTEIDKIEIVQVRRFKFQ